MKRFRPRCCCWSLSFTIWQFLALIVMMTSQSPLGTVHAAMSYTISIPPNEEECYLLSVPSRSWTSSHRFIGSFEMLDDDDVSPDLLSAYVMIGNEKQTILYRVSGKTRGDFNVHIPKGPNAAVRYWLCFQNYKRPHKSIHDERHSDSKTRTIGFTYRLIETDIAFAELKKQQIIHDKTKSDTWKQENVNDWNKRSIELENDLHLLVEHHQYLKIREASHRTLVEQTFSDVLTWTFAEACMVILVAVGQVLYFRRFLETKRYIQ